MIGTVIVKPMIHEPTGTGPHLPVLSEAGSMSYFAKDAGLGYNPPATAHDDNEGGKGDEGGGGPIAQVNSQQLNKDFNQRPRDEPAVTVNPATGTVVGGANDYGIGGPVGGGVFRYRSLDGLDWTRPIVNRLAGGPATGGGIRTITYYDGGPSGLDCHIFNDKEWIAVDNNAASSF